MNCPKCGGENPDDVQVCSSCGIELSKVSCTAENPVPRMSRLAIAAFVCAILSPFTFGVTFFAAIVLGVISISTIDKSGGRLSGRNFAVLGIVVPVFIFFVLLWPAFLYVRRVAYKIDCATNLTQIGMSMLVYANDYNDKLPRSGGKDSTWAMQIPNWKANNRSIAYGLADDGSGGQGSISSCFYLLIKYSYPPHPKIFICKGDTGATEFRPADDGAGDNKLIDLWDFGPAPSEHCSYSYHQPFSRFPLTTSSEPGMAIAPDRNPWIRTPSHKAKNIKFYNPDGGVKGLRAGNAVTHGENGQNVLFIDNHVGFERRAFCGINDDNIYTFWDGGDIRIGCCPVVGGSEPQDRLDSLLVHDAP